MVAIDTLGIMLGWQFMDHWAHLGGCGIGYWYAKQGSADIWWNARLRAWLLEQRAEVRRLVEQLY